MTPTQTAGLRARATAALQHAYYGPVPGADGDYARSVAWDEAGSAIARETLAAGAPCLIARLGSSEVACVSYYVRWRRKRLLPVPYPSVLRAVMQTNAGVFPVDDASLDRFAETFIEAITQTDVMGVWFNRGEEAVVRRFCPDARLVQLEALNVVLRERPWSAELAGKTVLVVHPFAATIELQYRTNRARLFANPEVLPEFQLKTLPAVQSGAGGTCEHKNWSAALGHMIEQVSAIDFDAAVIGAGAYGLPLGSAIKKMGRQAVHLGGQTQLLFGIRGRRWEDESPDEIAPLMNEYWVRPSAEETPEGARHVEGGCYW